MSVKTSSKTEIAFFVAVATIGLVVTVIAVFRWAPESVTRLPAAQAALRSAAADSQALGYRLEGEPQVRVSNGHREIGAPSPPLCSGLPARDEQVEVSTEPGDVLVLFTDVTALVAKLG